MGFSFFRKKQIPKTNPGKQVEESTEKSLEQKHCVEYRAIPGSNIRYKRINQRLYRLNLETNKWCRDLSSESEWAWDYPKGKVISMEDPYEFEIGEGKREYWIGRGDDCDIRLKDSLLLDRHAVLWYYDGRWNIQTVDGASELKIDGHTTCHGCLTTKNQIQLGNSQIKKDGDCLYITSGSASQLVMLYTAEILDQICKNEKRSRYRGCLLGGAVGDALGYPVEFISEAAIWEKYGSKGIQSLEDAGQIANISDDTQMTLFAANALIVGMSNSGLNENQVLLRAYQEWLGTQGDYTFIRSGDRPQMWIYDDKRLHAFRAPGNTCLAAIRSTKGKRKIWPADNNSKGCGTVMRAAPFGLGIHHDPNYHGDELIGVHKWAKYDAGLTHGHPMAYASSSVLAQTVYKIVQTKENSWERLEKYLADGIPGVPEIGLLLKKAVNLANDSTVSDLDGIHQLGEGWVAEAFSLKSLELRDVIETIADDLFQVVEMSAPEPGKDSVWDRKYRGIEKEISFGQYPQTKDGLTKPIQWKILERKDGKMLLIAKDCLILSGYCDFKWPLEDLSVLKWKNCLARSCCQNFYKEAFSEEEKQRMMPHLTTDESEQTEDFVFLLSEEEVEELLPTLESRRSRPSEYVRQNPDYRKIYHGNGSGEEYTSWWLLPQIDKYWNVERYPKAVWPSGEIQYHSRNVYHTDFSIRPCICIRG